MIALDKYEVWLATGSQALYGEETLAQVLQHANVVALAATH